MNRCTRFFLVVLQLCIGWHLFYEGVWKVQQRDAWSSKGYLRNATGPFALPLRWLAGDPIVSRRDGALTIADAEPDFLARFDVKPIDMNVAPENRKLHQHVPPVIDDEWNRYFERFVKHYQLDDPNRRDELAGAESKFLQTKADLVEWLTSGVTKTKPPGFGGNGEVPQATPQRLQAYHEKMRQIAELESGDAELFGSKAAAAKIQGLRAEAGMIRNGLQADLDRQTSQMKRMLFWEALTPEKRRMDRVPSASSPEPEWARVAWFDNLMGPAFQTVGWSWPNWNRLQWIDRLVRWGLVAAGLGLILGLFTRTACALGIALLLLFYLAMPPLPGSTESPAGHYLFINFNIIEIAALLLIAVSNPSGRYGLDAWMPFRWLRRRRTAAHRSEPWPST